MNRFYRLMICLLVLLPGTPATSTAKDAWLAWQSSGEPLRVHRLEGSASVPSEVPLGSTWKLFVFTYLQGTNARESAYRCDASARSRTSGDEYCCDPGEQIDRSTALSRSCGNYFEPARLGIREADWRRYWQALDAPSWLQSLTQLKPDTHLPISQIMAGLNAIVEPSRQSARSALAPSTLNSADGTVISAWGSGTRFKTFSWNHPRIQGASLGGAAGWLADGTPFWLGGQGASGTVLGRLAAQASQILPRPDRIVASGPCVHVDFLTRYPIKAVIDSESRKLVSDGILSRRYRVKLENGNTVDLNAAPAAGEIVLELGSPPALSKRVGDESGRAFIRPLLSGRFTLNEYIGRVIDREADAQATQAAQALAVAARTYLLQNASFEAGCYRIADDSRTQRVSLNPASRSARAAALATDELVLSGTTVRYHRNQASPGVMSWQAAQAQSDRGLSFTSILRENWPDASLVVMDANSPCKPIAEAQTFMATAMPRWQRQLAREPGFEMPKLLRICTLDFGHPYTDLRRSSIYLRQWQTHEGRLTLAHEFIHLAFARHPNGSDERYAEHWARILIDSLAAPQVSVSAQ